MLVFGLLWHHGLSFKTLVSTLGLLGALLGVLWGPPDAHDGPPGGANVSEGCHELAPGGSKHTNKFFLTKCKLTFYTLQNYRCLFFKFQISTD